MAAHEGDLVVERQELARDRIQQGRGIAVWKVGAADRSAEQDVADDRERQVGRDEHEMTGRVAGTVQDVEFGPGDLDPLALGQPAVGRDRGTVLDAELHRLMRQPVQQEGIAPIGTYHRNRRGTFRAGRVQLVAQGRGTGGVVDMAMGQKDLVDLHAVARDRGQDHRHVTARVDDGAAAGRLVEEDRAVLPKRRDGDDDCLEHDHDDGVSEHAEQTRRVAALDGRRNRGRDHETIARIAVLMKSAAGRGDRGETTVPRAMVLLAAGLVSSIAWTGPLAAQESVTPPSAVAAPAETDTGVLAPVDLDHLIAPVALFPDPLLSLILQAATLPLQVVQADRFLDQVAQDKRMQPPEDWDPAVLGLLNYPPVIKGMSAQLDWTQNLGDAVMNQLADVQASIQQVRSEVQARGGLVTDDKNQVIVSDGIIQIVPADPDKIYIPRYDYVPAAQAELPTAAAQPALVEASDVEPATAEPVAAEPPPPDAKPATPEETAGTASAESNVVVEQPAAAPPPAYPTYAGYPPPPVAYSQPYPSYTSTAATFVGGAFVGGIIGYAIGDDDDDYHGYGGDGRRTNISGNTVNIVGNGNRPRSATDVQAQLRQRSGTNVASNRQQRVNATGLAPAKRPAISAVPGASARPAVRPTGRATAVRDNKGGLGQVTSARDTRQTKQRVQHSKSVGKPAASRPAAVRRAASTTKPTKALASKRSGSSAFAGVGRGGNDRKAGKRGASSRSGKRGGRAGRR